MLDLKLLLRNQKSRFADSASSCAGFSFKYAGKIVGPALGDEWGIVTEEKPQSRTTSFSHPDGLQVVCETRAFPEHGCLQYQLRLRNRSARPLPILSALQPLCLVFDNAPPARNYLVSGCGPADEGVLPPRSFAIHKRQFEPLWTRTGSTMLRSEGGRSSSKDLPFFFVQNDEIKEGLFVAFGWSGQWEVMVSQAPSRLEVRGRVPDIHLALESGEEIIGPTILVGLYEGELIDGVNQLRRTVRQVYAPKLGEQEFFAVATYDTLFNGFDVISEAEMIEVVDAAASVGLEYFLLDAGWYEGDGWFNTLGSWNVNRARFPRGLTRLASHTRDRGMQFGLWFEPERVAEGSILATQHPDWVLWEHDSRTCPPWFSNAPWVEDLSEAGSTQYNSGTRFGLLDFGRKEVQEWVQEMMDSFIKEYGIKYIRFDSNIDPLPYWNVADKPNRRGISQLRHIAGLYAVIDWLRARHPCVILEGCASGGRRIDLEMVRRFHTFWICDYSYDPTIARFHLHGINHFLPGSYNYIAYGLEADANIRIDDLGFQSQFAGALGMSCRVDKWSVRDKELARNHLAKHKTIRRFLNGDYYPFGGVPDGKNWGGWQFHDSTDQSGFLQTFRSEDSNARRHLLLKGLRSDVRYRFSDLYGLETFEVSGFDAMSIGIEIEQGVMTSRILTYSVV